jgi:hypothetical protein
MKKFRKLLCGIIIFLAILIMVNLYISCTTSEGLQDYTPAEAVHEASLGVGSSLTDPPGCASPGEQCAGKGGSAMPPKSCCGGGKCTPVNYYYSKCVGGKPPPPAPSCAPKPRPFCGNGSQTDPNHGGKCSWTDSHDTPWGGVGYQCRTKTGKGPFRCATQAIACEAGIPISEKGLQCNVSYDGGVTYRCSDPSRPGPPPPPPAPPPAPCPPAGSVADYQQCAGSSNLNLPSHCPDKVCKTYKTAGTTCVAPTPSARGYYSQCKPKT